MYEGRCFSSFLGVHLDGGGLDASGKVRRHAHGDRRRVVYEQLNDGVLVRLQRRLSKG